jgi:hypothetical protein
MWLSPIGSSSMLAGRRMVRRSSVRRTGSVTSCSASATSSSTIHIPPSRHEVELYLPKRTLRIQVVEDTSFARAICDIRTTHGTPGFFEHTVLDQRQLLVRQLVGVEERLELACQGELALGQERLGPGERGPRLGDLAATAVPHR